MNKVIFLFMVLCLFALVGCHSPFVDVGVGYVRFETDDIIDVKITDQGNPVTTEIDSVNSFLLKARFGAGFVEALPQLRAGVEIRGGIGAGYDEEDLDGEEVYAQLLMLMLGGGPFISWKQPLGDYVYIEIGTIAAAYTVGIHESEREDSNGDFVDFEDEGGTGWSGGAFAKIGLLRNEDMPFSFALEGSYEYGKWDFGGDIGNVDAQGISVLLSSEIDF